MGKWVYMSDSGPNTGCGCLILIVIAFFLLKGCDSKGAVKPPNHSPEQTAK